MADTRVVQGGFLQVRVLFLEVFYSWELVARLA